MFQTNKSAKRPYSYTVDVCLLSAPDSLGIQELGVKHLEAVELCEDAGAGCRHPLLLAVCVSCLLYTSDAADE